MRWLLRFLEVEHQLDQTSEKHKMQKVKADFIHKFKISAKEADELDY